MGVPFSLIFDMDGVIVDSNPFHKIALKQYCAQHGHHLTEKDLLEKIYGRTNRDWIVNIFGNLSTEKINEHADRKEELYRALYQDKIVPVNGLTAFLEMLLREQISTAIATSAPRENVVFTLERTGTSGYFQTILDESFVQRGKPDPEIYLKTVAALKQVPQQCIVIEDSLSGISAAQQAGYKVIGITTTHSAAELRHTDLTISDFNELALSDLYRLTA